MGSDRTYEELKHGGVNKRATNGEVSSDRTYEELKLLHFLCHFKRC